MQTTPPPSAHTWLDIVWYLIAIIVAGSAGWFTAWRGRKRPAAEIDLSEAQADRERAERRKLDADVTKTYNDIIRDINKDLRDALVENEGLRTQAGLVPHLQDTIKLYEKQLSDQECIISAAGINKGEALDAMRGIKPE